MNSEVFLKIGTVVGEFESAHLNPKSVGKVGRIFPPFRILIIDKLN